MNAERDILVKRLLEAGFDSRRFLKLGNKGDDKAAFEDDWPDKLYTPEEMGDHPYWGICGRDGLVLVDADKVSMEAILRQILPPTFEVRSPRRGLAHFYYAVEGEQVENKVLSLKGEEEKAGEIRAKNMYLVAPGTEIHYKDLRTSEPKIGRYTILQDRPFAKINYADFMAAVTPYLGSDPKQPITFKQMRKGVPQGSRHPQGIKLAAYLVGTLKFDSATALYAMCEWNEKNRPPMDGHDLERMVKNAIEYVAADPTQKRGKTDKPVADTLNEIDFAEKIVYDSDTEKTIESEVQKIVDADNQLDALNPHLNNMIVGENNVKKAAAILLLSGKVSNPKMKQIILFKSTEGAGKSYTATALTRGYKTKHVGRFSEHALDYTDLKGYEVLFLKELGLMDEEKQGVSTLKFLSSDDLGYTVEVTVKDEETGKFTTEQRRIPPITVISTTTRLIMDKQFERRAFPFGLDESAVQTEAIADWTAENELQEAEKLLGTRTSTEQEISTAVYSRFIERFVPKNIIIPFPKTLLKVLGVKVLRVRGDMNKLLTFMKLYGQLNVKRLKSAGKDSVYVLSSAVAREALNIILEPLGDMLSRIDKRTKQVFDGLKEIVDIETVKVLNVVTEKQVRYDAKGSEIDKKLRDRIAVKIDKSESTIRRFLNQLESSGYVSGDGKRPKTFTLLYDVSEIETKIRGISCKIESHDALITEMDNEAQEWLRRLSCNMFLGGSETVPDKHIVGIPEHNKGGRGTDPDPSPEIVLHDTSLPPSRPALAGSSLDYCAIQKCTVPREEKQRELGKLGNSYRTIKGA